MIAVAQKEPVLRVELEAFRLLSDSIVRIRLTFKDCSGLSIGEKLADLERGAMTEQSLDLKFRRIIAAIAAGELESLDSLIRYDVIDHNLIVAQGDGLPGLKYWARSLRGAIPDLQATVQDTVVEGSKVAARVRWTGTYAGTFLPTRSSDPWVEFDSFYILHFENGLAVQWWDGTDTRETVSFGRSKTSLPPHLRPLEGPKAP